MFLKGFEGLQSFPKVPPKIEEINEEQSEKEKEKTLFFFPVYIFPQEERSQKKTRKYSVQSEEKERNSAQENEEKPKKSKKQAKVVIDLNDNDEIEFTDDEKELSCPICGKMVSFNTKEAHLALCSGKSLVKVLVF